MNIALVTNLYPPIQTGSAYWAQELATALARHGDQVIVVTCGTAPKVVVEEGVIVYRPPPVIHLPRREFFLNFDQFYLLSSGRNLQRLVALLREHRVELVHQCGQLLDSLILTIQACRRLDLPAVCSIHTKVYHPTNRLYNGLFRAADRLGVARLVRRFELVVALDGVLADYVKTIYRPRRVVVVPVCVDDAITREPPAEPASPGPIRILSLGHVTEMRSRRDLLMAVADLRRVGHDLRIMIAGKVLTERTQAMIDQLGLAHHAVLLGEVPRGPQLFDLFRSSHLEAHWLDMPGIGSAGLEAMALGLPVVTHAYAGIFGDVPLRHGENIMFVDPQRPRTIYDALHALASDAALRAQMGARARSLVQEHLTWSVMVRRMRRLYSEVLC